MECLHFHLFFWYQVAKSSVLKLQLKCLLFILHGLLHLCGLIIVKEEEKSISMLDIFKAQVMVSNENVKRPEGSGFNTWFWHLLPGIQSK